MPLSFESASHGRIAFGFFNIESDLLLLENLFFFAGDFCTAAAELVEERGKAAERLVAGWRIEGFERLGNLHGAIAGTDLSGFIGATYAVWPFPENPGGFKQNPEGARTREKVKALIRGFGRPEQLPFRRDAAGALFGLAEYEFDRRGFLELAAYVERGGYPRWRDEVRPAYVRVLVESLEKVGLTLPP